MLNWIVWNDTVFDIENVITLTELFNKKQFWHLFVYKQNLYLYKGELFELELSELTE